MKTLESLDNTIQSAKRTIAKYPGSYAIVTRSRWNRSKTNGRNTWLGFFISPNPIKEGTQIDNGDGSTATVLASIAAN